MQDIIDEFIAETVENLNDLDVALISFEENPDDKNLLDKIFRTLHTVKGTCGFLGMARLEKVAHTAETLLDQFRSKGRKAQSSEVALILQSLDRIREIIDGIAETGAEPSGDDTPLIASLQNAIDGSVSVAVADMSVISDTLPDDIAFEDIPSEMPSSASSADMMDDAASMEMMAAAMMEKGETDMGVSPVAAPVVSSPVPPPVLADKNNDKNADSASRDASAAQFLRVNVDTLESLMTMVSELVLTRNQLVQSAKTSADDVLSGSLQRLNFVVSELQDRVMKTRMQPIGNAWTKLPRIIHDIARDQDKKITLNMYGEETEIDRQVLEMIKDPLMHMVRNSADHGIEEPGERIIADKPITGVVTLKAWHEGGYITIQISDDGRGMDHLRIRRKIVEKGLAAQDYVDTLTERQVLQYIFAPGFSTADKVTAVSGRGVGMDVVRTNIEKIGGTIDLESRYNVGSCFTIRIPLTLAIVSALIVECGDERYAIPQLNVQELVKISNVGSDTIEWVGGRPVLRFRDRILPLAPLRELLDNTQAQEGDWDISDCYIVVTNSGTSLYGIVVDRVYDTEEIVVKPVSSLLKPLDIYAGNTILGDGRVIMILDPAGVAQMAYATDDNAQLSHDMVDADDNSFSEDDLAALLLFKAGENERVAVPAFLVSRIEEFPRKRIEFSGGRPVLQYEGRLIDLHILAQNVSGKDTVKALIFADDRSANAFGVIVDEIFDIVHSRMDIKAAVNRPGFLGTAIIDGRATEIFDINHYSGAKDWFTTEEIPFAEGGIGGGAGGHTRPRVLVVDDSSFFRNMLYPLLNMAGYAVTMVDGPISALQLCERGADFDLIISDIEMDGMNGFDFAAKVKTETRWRDIPMVALSSHATPQDVALGYERGFSAYVAKSNRNALLSTLKQMLESKSSVSGGQAA